MAVTMDIHGSCVSRSCFELLDPSEVRVGQYFARNNMVSCMMPPADLSFAHGDLIQYNSAYSEGCMRLALNKRTFPLLLASDAEYIVIDFFDFCQPVVSFFDTTFSSYDYTFFNTPVYKNNSDKFALVDWLTSPIYLWYGYVDAYFQRIKEKFQDHVILNRLSCSNIYISKACKLHPIPENKLYFGNAKYNSALYELENYIIDKYHPFVIDISKYFIPDEAYNPDVTLVHYEESYNILQSNIIKQIAAGKTVGEKYFDTLSTTLVANLLRRPVSDQDFLTIYLHRELPFNSDSLLDYIFQTWSLEEAVQNRIWIADLYENYAAHEDKVHLNGGTLQFLLTGDESGTLKGRVYQYISEVDAHLKLSVSELYRCFLDNFEQGHSYEWMLELNILSLLEPHYEDVPFYLSQFYAAAGDEYSLRKQSLHEGRNTV